MSTLAVDVPFHDGTLPCLLDPRDLTPYVLLRPVCRALGLDFDVHHKRLRQQSWAVVTTQAIAGAGEDVAIDKLTFAMWLATVQPGRMRSADARAKIELYQRDAVRAVERYFGGGVSALGTQEAGALPLALPAWELVGELVERQAACEHRSARVNGTHTPTADAAGAHAEEG